MPFKIVRNDITKMDCDAIVNTASETPDVGPGCDYAIYTAAGFDKLLSYRKEKIGVVAEGEAFLTPSFNLSNKYIIHVVSPLYIDGESKEEEKLRNCYRNGLKLATENGCRTVAFPLISTGSFGYPKEEGLRIAIDEITQYPGIEDMLIYLVVYDKLATSLGKKYDPKLEDYIRDNFETDKPFEERNFASYCEPMPNAAARRQNKLGDIRNIFGNSSKSLREERTVFSAATPCYSENTDSDSAFENYLPECEIKEEAEFDRNHAHMLNSRIKHLSDSFSDYLLYLIEERNMTNAEVYKRAIVDKKVFSKIKSNHDYHPQKMTAMCLCVGAKLNLDEAKDLLARAGYALSPCDKTDVIFSYFIENGIYDMIELDIQLEEHGLKCLIS